jgi:hypothetical protein
MNLPFIYHGTREGMWFQHEEEPANFGKELIISLEEFIEEDGYGGLDR